MVAGSYAHGVFVEHLADVVGVDAVEEERDGAAADRRVERSEDPERVGEALGERVERVAREPHLVVAHRGHAERGHVVDGGAEADRLGDRLRARFELPRHVVGGEAVEADVADHLAAAEERRHLLEQRLARPERTDAARPAHLVRRRTRRSRRPTPARRWRRAARTGRHRRARARRARARRRRAGGCR